jgi:hypothetical protein
MNTDQIEYHLREMPGFYGVHASNAIPHLKLRETPSGVVVNLDPNYLPGSHWVCSVVYKKKDKKILEFFDSYGLRPDEKYAPGDWTIHYNPWRLQNPNSKVCGQYCIFFIRERLGGAPFIEIITRLRKKRYPDKFVVNYVKRLKNKIAHLQILPNQTCQSSKRAPGRKEGTKYGRCKLCDFTLV